MCESCQWPLSRRDFLGTTLAFSAAAGTALPGVSAQGEENRCWLPGQKNRSACGWSSPVSAGGRGYCWSVGRSMRRHQWFTWPGNQFQPELQERKFTEKIQDMVQRLGIRAEFAPRAIFRQVEVEQYIAAAQSAKPDAVLVINFWNTFAEWSYKIATEAAPRSVVYQPVGSNHQLPREYLRKTPRLWYIHSIENWGEVERSLRALRAGKMVGQSRLLRVSTQVKELTQSADSDLGVEIVHVPTQELIDIFDRIPVDESLETEARQIRQKAVDVWEVSDEYLVEVVRSAPAVQTIMNRYGADAVTIECLMLKHRKPCPSFALLNGDLTPAGCENMVDGTITMMIGRWLVDRAGFMHNPEFDTTENLYMGAHCTCAWKLHGPEGPEQKFILRPFFHQLPKTAAAGRAGGRAGEPVLLAKYYSPAARKSAVGPVG